MARTADPRPCAQAGLCEAFSRVYISVPSSLKNGTAKETPVGTSPAGLRNPIILSAAGLFTRRITRGATSVQGSLGRVNVCSSSALFLLQSRMWQDPSHVKAFKLRGRSKPWAKLGGKEENPRTQLHSANPPQSHWTLLPQGRTGFAPSTPIPPN